ncbi:hypothetical protein [Bradyrhizobium jicamae]|nr:hypothetical protein [Bradyrhizobium jicamae]
MKRAFVFLVLAPASVFSTVVLTWIAVVDTRSLDFACLCGAVLAILTLPTSAITGAIDGFFVRACPFPSRACLTAIAGATVATAETAVFSTLLSPTIVAMLALGSAVVAGACSLLSNDYSGRQRYFAEPISA